jgi:hypothetical protein
MIKRLHKEFDHSEESLIAAFMWSPVADGLEWVFGNDMFLSIK